MRPQALVAGGVILLLGLFLLLYPMDQSVGSEYASPTSAYVFFEPGLTPGALSFAVTWYTSAPVTVTVYSCGSDTSCSGGTQYAVPSHLVQQQTSAAGSITFAGAAGTGYEVYASSANTLIFVDYTGPILGGFLGAVFVGIAVLAILVGLVAKPRPAGAGRRARLATSAAALSVPGPPGGPAPPPSAGTVPPPPYGGAATPASLPAAGLAGYTPSPSYPGAAVPLTDEAARRDAREGARR